MKIERWGWYSVVINIVLAVIDTAVALYSGSLAVKAEILHNIVDLATAVAVLFGLKIASRKSKNFPYGLYKIENIISLIMAVVIFFTAYEVARTAVLAPELEVKVAVWNLVALSAAALIAFVFSIFQLRAGKKSNSPSLIADAKEYRVHILTTGVIIIGLIGQKFNLNLDRIAAIIIVIIIAKTGWDLLVSGIRVLLDASLDPGMIEDIKKMILSEPQVTEIRWISGRNAGRVRFVEAGLALRVNDLKKAEKITKSIENKVKEKLTNIERVVLHPQPQKRQNILCALPLTGTSGKISDHFGEAPFFALVKINRETKQVQSRVIETNPYTELEKKKGIKVAEWLVEKKVDRIFLKKDIKNKGPRYVFDNAAVEISTINDENLSQTEKELYRKCQNNL